MERERKKRFQELAGMVMRLQKHPNFYLKAGSGVQLNSNLHVDSGEILLQLQV